jgi:hypothetical protein
MGQLRDSFKKVPLKAILSIFRGRVASLGDFNLLFIISETVKNL